MKLYSVKDSRRIIEQSVFQQNEICFEDSIANFSNTTFKPSLTVHFFTLINYVFVLTITRFLRHTQYLSTSSPDLQMHHFTLAHYLLVQLVSHLLHLYLSLTRSSRAWEDAQNSTHRVWNQTNQQSDDHNLLSHRFPTFLILCSSIFPSDTIDTTFE